MTLLIVALVAWWLFIEFVVPPVVAFIANRFWKPEDIGPPPPSGHGWIAPNAKKR